MLKPLEISVAQKMCLALVSVVSQAYCYGISHDSCNHDYYHMG